MKKYNFIDYWRAFTVIFFIFICLNLIFLSREVIHKAGPRIDNFTSFFEIDLCYRTDFEKDYCYGLDNSEDKIKKFEFNCNFKDSIACYTKNFHKLSAREIIGKFKQCEISNWAVVKSESENVIKTADEYLLYNGHICVKYKFKIKNNKEYSNFLIQSNQKNQPFNVYVTNSRTYEKDEEYRTKKSPLFQRTCWKENELNKCSETDKKIVFGITLYSAKNLEHPFTTNCVHRMNENFKYLTQNDCYENCIKKEKKYYRLTYDENDTFELDYNSASNLTFLIDKCSVICNQEDCTSTGFFVHDNYEDDEAKESENSSIIINLAPEDYRAEAVPLFEISKLVWMFSVFISIFFGINFHGFILNSTNLNNFMKFQRKPKKNRSKKLFKISLISFLISLCLSLILEKVLFNYGKENKIILRKRGSIVERNVSVSICFDFCKIIKDEFKSEINKCDDRKLFEKNVRELDEITWNASEFQSRASIRNSARTYPIRQNDYKVLYFFRNFKKCFLLFYQAKKYWTHLELQRYSRIHINVVEVSYAYFFIEDGHYLPTIKAKPTKKSVLHVVETYERRPRDGCIDYTNYGGSSSIKSKDDLIQSCVIKKYNSSSKALPVQVNIHPGENYSKYQEMKFKNDSESLFKIFSKECEQDYEKNECNYVRTHATHKEIFEGKDDISINLTPFINELKPTDDENILIVSNRIFSYLIILTGVSVSEFTKAIIAIYFFRFFSQFDFQFANRLFNLALFLLFLINFSFLFYNIIYHPMLETCNNYYAHDIEPSVIRFCFELDVDLTTYKYNLKYLELNTPNMSEILKNILIYDDENEVTVNLTHKEFDPESDYHRFSYRNDLFVDFIKSGIFYLDNLKCFHFYFQSKQFLKNLNTNFQRLDKLYSVTLKNFDRKKLKKDQVFIFLNAPYQYAFDFNKGIKLSDYILSTTISKSKYQDDYWYFKKFFIFLIDFVGISKSIDTIGLYLKYLKKCFMNEQYATTTLIPLYSNEVNNLNIKNRQFNYFMQFRAMVTNKNDYDFTKNTEKTVFSKLFYEKGSISESKEFSLTVGTNLLKFQENSRNRFRYIELFFHLFVLISFWYKVDFLTLPNSLKEAYPLFRYFTIYFLYYIVLFLIYLIELWLSFVRFLRFKND